MIFLSRPGQIVEPGNKPHHGDETGPQPVDDHGRPVAVLGFLAPAAEKSRGLKCIDERGRMRASPERLFTDHQDSYFFSVCIQSERMVESRPWHSKKTVEQTVRSPVGSFKIRS
jgi:hypothetical protein